MPCASLQIKRAQAVPLSLWGLWVSGLLWALGGLGSPSLLSVCSLVLRSLSLAISIVAPSFLDRNTTQCFASRWPALPMPFAVVYRALLAGSARACGALAPPAEPNSLESTLVPLHLWRRNERDACCATICCLCVLWWWLDGGGGDDGWRRWQWQWAMA